MFDGLLATAPSWIDNVVMLAVKVLATLGGAVLGGLSTGFLVQLLTKATLHKDVPRPALTLVRGLGALALGLVVWIGVNYGPGSGSFFSFGGRGGGGTGTTTGSGTGSLAQHTAATSPVTTRTTGRGETKRVVPKDTILVEMLGGERYANDQRFYLLDARKPPRTLPETTAAIKQRKQQDPNLQYVEILIYDHGSVDERHHAVGDLIKQVEELGLKVRTTRLGGSAPEIDG